MGKIGKFTIMLLIIFLSTTLIMAQAFEVKRPRPNETWQIGWTTKIEWSKPHGIPPNILVRGYLLDIGGNRVGSIKFDLSGSPPLPKVEWEGAKWKVGKLYGSKYILTGRYRIMLEIQNAQKTSAMSSLFRLVNPLKASPKLITKIVIQQPAKNGVDVPVHKPSATLGDEHMIASRLQPLPPCQVAPQPRHRRLMQRHQPGFLKLGFSDQQTVGLDVGQQQAQGFGNPHAGGCQQADQCHVGMRPQRVWWTQLCGGDDQTFDLDRRIDMRNAARFAIPEKVRWRRIVLGVVQSNVVCEAADRLIPRVPLGDRWALVGPVDRCRRADKLFPAITGKTREAAQQVFRVTEGKSGGTPQGQIGLDGLDHEFTSGQGWAICRSEATSTFA